MTPLELMDADKSIGFQIFKIVIGKADGDHTLNLVQLRHQVDLSLNRVGLNNCHDLPVGEHAVHLYAMKQADSFGDRLARTCCASYYDS